VSSNVIWIYHHKYRKMTTWMNLGKKPSLNFMPGDVVMQDVSKPEQIPKTLSFWPVCHPFSPYTILARDEYLLAGKSKKLVDSYCPLDAIVLLIGNMDR